MPDDPPALGFVSPIGGDVTDAEIEAVTGRRTVMFDGTPRPLNRLISTGRITIIQQQGRARAALLFDLGPCGGKDG